MFRSMLAFVLMTACWAGSPRSAAAQTDAGASDSAGTDDTRAEGKARYERGAEAYANGRFKDAIDLFLQADALAPSAPLSFNIARAYEKIGDDASALQWYRDYRRRAPDAKNAEQVDARIRSLEAALAEKGVQQLTVISAPPGATVVIDGQPRGVTPYTGQLTPGSHRVQLALRGYLDAEQAVELSADRARDLVVELSPDHRKDAAGSAGSKAPAAAPSDRQARRFGAWPWVTLGAGGLALGGALGFELARRSAESSARNDPTQVGRRSKLDDMEGHQNMARILAGVGGALALTGGVLLLIDQPRKTDDQQLSLACLPGNCAVALSGAFH
jgi:tetratricopeptide (TPR) repeat protein